MDASVFPPCLSVYEVLAVGDCRGLCARGRAELGEDGR